MQNTEAESKSPKISVIVPVYKVEKYLPECIESVLAQTFTDFELILVDDGSPDNSGKICDDYAKKDSRIRVFHKENGGVSSARNLGLDNARGEWIAFVDGDDLLCKSMLRSLYTSSYNELCDVVYCDYWQEGQFMVRYVPTLVSVDNRVELLNTLLSEKVWGVCWNKLIRISFLRDKEIHFPEGISMKEDLVFCLNVFLKARGWKHIEKALYYYRDREGSACSSYSKSKMVQRNTQALLDKVYDLFRDEQGRFRISLDTFEVNQRVRIAKNTVLSSNEKTAVRGYISCSDFPFRAKLLLRISSYRWGNYFFHIVNLVNSVKSFPTKIFFLILKKSMRGRAFKIFVRPLRKEKDCSRLFDDIFV